MKQTLLFTFLSCLTPFLHAQKILESEVYAEEIKVCGDTEDLLVADIKYNHKEDNKHTIVFLKKNTSTNLFDKELKRIAFSRSKSYNDDSYYYSNNTLIRCIIENIIPTRSFNEGISNNTFNTPPRVHIQNPNVMNANNFAFSGNSNFPRSSGGSRDDRNRIHYQEFHLIKLKENGDTSMQVIILDKKVGEYFDKEMNVLTLNSISFKRAMIEGNKLLLFYSFSKANLELEETYSSWILIVDLDQPEKIIGIRPEVLLKNMASEQLKNGDNNEYVDDWGYLGSANQTLYYARKIETQLKPNTAFNIYRIGYDGKVQEPLSTTISTQTLVQGQQIKKDKTFNLGAFCKMHDNYVYVLSTYNLKGTNNEKGLMCFQLNINNGVTEQVTSLKWEEFDSKIELETWFRYIKLLNSGDHLGFYAATPGKNDSKRLGMGDLMLYYNRSFAGYQYPIFIEKTSARFMLCKDFSSTLCSTLETYEKREAAKAKIPLEYVKAKISSNSFLENAKVNVTSVYLKKEKKYMLIQTP